MSYTSLTDLLKNPELAQALQQAWDAAPDKDKLKEEALKGETRKLHAARKALGWYEKFAPEHLSGIDIGCGFCPLNETFRRYDVLFGDGDATTMDDVSSNLFHTVYACHILEHLSQPDIAIKNWFRLVKPGGHLIVVVPCRDLYEKKKTLPSNYNPDHKWFWTTYENEPPHTLGLAKLIEKNLWDFNIKHLQVYEDGYFANGDDHPGGNYSIEAVVAKLKS